MTDFDRIVIAAIRQLAPNAYGVPIRQAVERELGRVVSYGALYVALDRLEERGLIAAREGEATAERGGRERRYYDLIKREEETT